MRSLLLLVGLIIAATGCQTAKVTHGIPNLAEVEPGVWRGGQPTEEGWKWLKEQDVHTVIKLNTDGEGSDAPASSYYGLTVWRLPIRFDQQIGVHQIPKDYFTDAIAAFPLPEAQRKMFGLSPDEKLNGNVFIHCSHGQDRTGLFVACYRVSGHQEGWLKAEAEKGNARTRVPQRATGFVGILGGVATMNALVAICALVGAVVLFLLCLWLALGAALWVYEAFADWRENRRIRRLCAFVVACLVTGFLGGCAWYQAQPFTPDNFNYTVSVDHQTGETVSYVGFGWSLKGGK